MKGTKMRSHMPYLDISEYLLKEHSPCFRPKMPEHHHQAPSPLALTPKHSPILDGIGFLASTPLAQAVKQIGHTVFESVPLDDLAQFSLEGQTLYRECSKTKKIKKSKMRPRLDSTWHLVDCDLELIVEENNRDEEIMDHSYESSEHSIEDEEEMEDFEDSSVAGEKIFEEERQSTTNFDLILHQEPLFLEWHHPNPKKQLLNKLKAVCSNQDLKINEDKLQEIKNVIGNYIFDHERFYFQDSMSQLSGSSAAILALLTRGVEQTFKKTIGGLSFEKRRMKLVKYMEKKKRRVWRKKVNYDCRKKVADGRLRIKGKFVTYEQAQKQLGMSSLEGYSADEIRNMLQAKAEP